MLVDDFCTEGNSFEAGRAFIEATGAKVICLSWLKTINTGYRAMTETPAIPSPFLPIAVTNTVASRLYGYPGAINSHEASTDLAEVHARYFAWEWPSGS